MAFPTSAIYDTCIRANEAPLNIASGGSAWAVSAGLGGVGLTACQILSNKAAPQSAASNQYLDVVDAADCEHYCTIDTMGSEIDLIIRLKDQANITTIDGYGIQVFPASVRISRIDNVVATTLNTFVQAISANDGVGISAVGSTLSAYYRSGLGGAWTLLGTASDATYAAGGRKGLTMAGSGSRVSNLGGGAIIPDSQPMELRGLQVAGLRQWTPKSGRLF